MAISEVGSQRNSITGSNSSVNLTYPDTPTEGNLLIVAMAWRGNNTVTATPSGWSLATNGGDGTGIDSAIYYKIAGASEPTAANFTISAVAFRVGIAFEYSGIVTTSPLDVVNSNSGNSTSGTTGATGTLAQASELIFTLFSSQNSSDTWGSHDNGLTEIVEMHSGSGTATSNCVLSIATKVSTVTDSINYGATLTTSRPWSSAVATFKELTDISVSLSGKSLTTSQDGLTDSLACALSGNANSVAQGSIADNLSTTLSGKSLSGSQGLIDNSQTGSIAGQQVSTNRGTVIASHANSLAGKQLSADQGSISHSWSVGLVGQNITLSNGVVTASTEFAMTGKSLSITQGSVTTGTGDVSVALTGKAVSMSLNTLSPELTKLIAGSDLSISSGSVTSTISKDISSDSLSVITGSVTQDQSILLSGQSLSVSDSVINVGYSVVTEGNNVTISKGSVNVINDGLQSVDLSGMSFNLGLGAIYPRIKRFINAQYVVSEINAIYQDIKINCAYIKPVIRSKYEAI